MLPAKTVENLRFRYIAGLSIIALLITTSFVTMQRVISEQRNYSNVVSLAGHQAGLVNRIAFFSSIMAISDDDTEFAMARAQVGRTLNKLTNAHQALRHGSEEFDLPKVILITIMTQLQPDHQELLPCPFPEVNELASRLLDCAFGKCF